MEITLNKQYNVNVGHRNTKFFHVTGYMVYPNWMMFSIKMAHY